MYVHFCNLYVESSKVGPTYIEDYISPAAVSDVMSQKLGLTLPWVTSRGVCVSLRQLATFLLLVRDPNNYRLVGIIHWGAIGSIRSVGLYYSGS